MRWHSLVADLVNVGAVHVAHERVNQSWTSGADDMIPSRAVFNDDMNTLSDSCFLHTDSCRLFSSYFFYVPGTYV